MPGCSTNSPTSRPRAAPSSNGSKARRCRGWRLWRRAEGAGELTSDRLAVLVHDRLEAEAALALAAGREVALVVPVGMVGPAFAKALEELLGRPVIAYCDDRPGLALEALRVGLVDLVLEDETTAARIADIARQQGGRLATTLPAPLHTVSANGRRLVPAALGAAGRLVP